MPTRRSQFARRGMIMLAAALCNWVQLSPGHAATVPAVPAGMARVWFTRDNSLYVEVDQSYVRMNGVIVGVIEPGSIFYRDVAPGRYEITVDTYGEDVNQFPRVALAAGQIAYFQILEPWTWASGGASVNWERPTFYVWPMPALVAPQNPVPQR